MDEKCTWHQEEFHGDTWATDCNHYFTMVEDTPKENGFNFCPFCGKEIEQHEYSEDE